MLDSTGIKSCDVKMTIRDVKPFNNKELRLITSKLYASVLDLTGIKLHWYVDIFPLHTNNSSVVIGSSVLMIHSIYRKLGDIKINRIVPTTNLLKYLTPPQHASSNTFVEHKLNPVSLELINTFKENSGSRIITGNKGGVQLMGSLSKT